MLNLLGSHDMARFVTLADGDQSALRLATLFQMTYTGAPSVYYGDEIGMAGGHDPANRGAFPWHKTDTWDTDLLHEFQRLIALRRARPALRRGSFRFLHAHDEVIAYARQLGDETVVVAINAGRGPHRLDIAMAGILPDGAVLEQAWSNQTVPVEQGKLRGDRAGAAVGRRAGDAGRSVVMNAFRRPAGVAASRTGSTPPSGSTRTRPGWRPRRTPTSPITRCSGSTPGSSTSGSPTPGRLVDLGCGAGRHAIRFAERGVSRWPPWTCPGRCWRSSARRRCAAGVDLLRVETNLCRLGCFPDATFDYAALDVQHAGDDPRTRRRGGGPWGNSRRILRPGGRLALHAHNLWLNLRDRQGRAWLIKHALRSIFTRDELGERRMTYRGIPGMRVHLYRWGELKRSLLSRRLPDRRGPAAGRGHRRADPMAADGPQRPRRRMDRLRNSRLAHRRVSEHRERPVLEDRCSESTLQTHPRTPRVRCYDERRGITAGRTDHGS